jgi:hypothetical protein
MMAPSAALKITPNTEKCPLATLAEAITSRFRRVKVARRFPTKLSQRPICNHKLIAGKLMQPARFTPLVLIHFSDKR